LVYVIEWGSGGGAPVVQLERAEQLGLDDLGLGAPPNARSLLTWSAAVLGQPGIGDVRVVAMSRD
jgi:hypothetical protein